MASAEGDEFARLLAMRVLARLPALTDELVEIILEENTAYQELGRVPEAQLWTSCHDNLGRVLQLLAAGRHRPRDGHDELYDAAEATGRSRAEQAMPLDDVLGSYRLGGRLVWQAITQQARSDSLLDADGLLDLGTRVWEVVDETSARVAAVYHTTERRLVRADEQRLATLWEGLLQGRAVEPGFAQQVSQLLGLPARGSYAVVVTVPQAGRDEAIPWSLEGRLRAVGVGSAWQLRDDVLIGLISLAASTVDSALAVLRRQLRGPTGLSLVVHGLGEIGSAYVQAELARQTLGAVPTGFAALSEQLPEALLLGAPDLAKSLVEEWLGPVLQLPDSDRDLLLDTLQAWLKTAGSAVHTAKAVHCHRNTVINRVRRIEALIGYDLHGGVAPLEVLLALRARAVLPSF